MNKLSKIALVCGIVFFAACHNKNSSTVQMTKEETKEYYDEKKLDALKHGLENKGGHGTGHEVMDTTHKPAEMHEDAHSDKPGEHH